MLEAGEEVVVGGGRWLESSPATAEVQKEKRVLSFIVMFDYFLEMGTLKWKVLNDG